MSKPSGQSLAGARVAITRPVGTGGTLRAQVRTLGGSAISLPGSSLRPMDDARSARGVLRDALRCDVVIFISPAAVRLAALLLPLRTRAMVIVPGAGTAAALRRIAKLQAIVPPRADSEGMLALPELQRVRGQHIAIIGAPGGRGLLESVLAKRGARIAHAQVYRRVPARLDRRHVAALMRSRTPLYVPLSSSEALRNLLATLPADARAALLAGTAIASSERLSNAARAAGFARVQRADSANNADLLAAIVSAHARR